MIIIIIIWQEQMRDKKEKLFRGQSIDQYDAQA
jgi:hypothetical protein